MNDDIPVARRYLPPPAKAQGSSDSWRLGLSLGLALLALLLSTTWAAGGLGGLGERRESLLEGKAGQFSVSHQGEERLSLLGHYAYAEAPPESLQVVGYYHGREVRLRHAAAESYRRMSAAAQADGIQLVPISGFRSVAEQEALFFQVAQAQALRPGERAAVSAPPGYSEHHTGYAIDIGDAQFPQWDTQEAFEKTPAFRWLEKNAARFGFELSFPRGNPQGVSYEPWHWRFVGDRHSLETFYKH